MHGWNGGRIGTAVFMDMRSFSIGLWWVAVLAGVQANATITVSSSSSTSLLSGDASKAIGSLPVQAGDYLAVLAASNLGSAPVNSSLLVTPSGGASVSTIQFSDNIGFGPGTFVWLRQVDSGGTLDLSMDNSGGAFISVAAYVIRATAGETIGYTYSDAADSSGTASGITNSHTFSGSATGLVVEAVSTYASGGTTASQIVFDEINTALKRGIGRASFSGQSTFNSGYSLSGSNSKTVVSGIAFTAAYIPTTVPNPLTTGEVARIENDLGIVLSSLEKNQLAAIVKPQGAVPQWRADAEARIETHRKADLDVMVVDANGHPVEGAMVRARLRKNAFKFGGVVQAQDLTDAEGKLAAASYSIAGWENLVTNLFNAVGMGNNLKPRLTSLHPYTPGFMDWAGNNGLDVRGHLLIWPGSQGIAEMDTPGNVIGVDYGLHLSEGRNNQALRDIPGYEGVVSYDVQQAVLDYKDSARTQADKDALEAEVDAEIGQWAGLWNVYEWDVINEAVNNYLLQDILGYDQMAEWFKIAESNAVNPECKLLINDYQIISAVDDIAAPWWMNYTNRTAAYRSRIDQIITDGGRLDRIGFQNRYKFGMPDPEIAYDRLVDWGNTYGREMVGTELEVIDNPSDPNYPYDYSEEERAQITEQTLTVYYSHPLTTGLFNWTFMHENDEKALAYYDGTVKLNGLAWYYLHHIRYSTDESGATDESGQTGLRGHKGEYDISVAYNGKDYSTAYTLTSNGTAVVVLDDVDLAEMAYGMWVAGYPTLGGQTNKADNPDGDPLDNFGEYALGGNPTNGADAGIASLFASGPGYFEYIHVRRNDNSYIDYWLETCTNLVSGAWSNTGYTVVGTNTDFAAPNFEAVTNRIPTHSDAVKFIRLRYE